MMENENQDQKRKPSIGEPFKRQLVDTLTYAGFIYGIRPSPERILNWCSATIAGVGGFTHTDGTYDKERMKRTLQVGLLILAMDQFDYPEHERQHDSYEREMNELLDALNNEVPS